MDTVIDIPETVLMWVDDSDVAWEDEDLVEKYGTAEGARKAWITRRRSLEDKLKMAVQARDAIATRRLQAQIALGDVVNKHLPNQHDQQSHAGGLLQREDLKQLLSKVDVNYTREEEDVIRDYRGAGYRMLNSELRRGKGLDDPRIKVLDDALAKASLPKDVMVVRGISGTKLIEKLQNAEYYEDKAYLSTSLSTYGVKQAMKDTGVRKDATTATMFINVPKGTTAIFVDKVSRIGSFLPHALGIEDELILPRNLKLKIIGHNGNEYQYPNEIYLEVVKEEKHLPGHHEQKDHGRKKVRDIAKDILVTYVLGGAGKKKVAGVYKVPPKALKPLTEESREALKDRVDEEGNIELWVTHDADYISELGKNFGKPTFEPSEDANVMSASISRRGITHTQDVLYYDAVSKIKVPFEAVLVYVPAILDYKDIAAKAGSRWFTPEEIGRSMIKQDEVILDGKYWDKIQVLSTRRLEKHLPGHHEQKDHGRKALELAKGKAFINRQKTWERVRSVSDELHGLLDEPTLTDEQSKSFSQAVSMVDDFSVRIKNSTFIELSMTERSAYEAVMFEVQALLRSGGIKTGLLSPEATRLQRLIEEIKHLPNRHDQKTHGREMMHGTSSTSLKAILKQGILPYNQLPKSKQSLRGGGHYEGELGNSVYMTADDHLAERFAVSAIRRDSQRAVIVKVRIPEGVEIKTDEYQVGGLRVMDKIPPEWILGYKVQTRKKRTDDPVWGDWQTVEKSEVDRILFVPVVVEEDIEEKSAYPQPMSSVEMVSVGTTPSTAQLLYEIESRGGKLPDELWLQWKEEIMQLIRAKDATLVEISNGGAGGTVRQIALTSQGRLRMLSGRIESLARS